MPSLEMNGPFKLNATTIKNKVAQGKIGNYALGHMKGNTFIVEYVGRSDNDVAWRLECHIPEGYQYFKFSYANTIKAAFEKECRNYHDFGENVQLNNKIHPNRPKGCNYECPRCNIYD